ncbi:MAG: reactive intermediate/imine deaminase [Bacteroidetes bacterium]|jgi:2-iminobutanoate/2-iminopropanoate deaminase|nr:reactive intermediate/imine deaminase [Bacteroidota bacterium]
MIKKNIHTDLAPKAVGPYSQAVVYNNTVYCSGQIALDPGNMNLVSDNIEEQTKQIMKNLEAVLLEAGSNFGKVVKCTIYILDMKHFETVNRVYGSFFGEEPPARETVAVSALPKGAAVEISCIAAL